MLPVFFAPGRNIGGFLHLLEAFKARPRSGVRYLAGDVAQSSEAAKSGIDPAIKRKVDRADRLVPSATLGASVVAVSENRSGAGTVRDAVVVMRVVDVAADEITSNSADENIRRKVIAAA